MPDVLYEDNHVLVAVKPPNMLSQAAATGDPDILSMMKEYIRERYQKPGNVYLGLVHRLDRPVGGLMVFARTSKAAARLSAQLQTHDMGREYVCVVYGEAEEKFTLTDYLVHDPILNRQVVCEADAKGGKLAILHGRCVAQRGGTSLCVIRLETGRKHQIRAQMSNAGLPLWGDARYGSGMAGQQIALWGFKLTFSHPVCKAHFGGAVPGLVAVPPVLDGVEGGNPLDVFIRALRIYESSQRFAPLPAAVPGASSPAEIRSPILRR